MHYVLAEGRSRGQCRPAVVVRDWTGVAYHDQPETCNLIAFIDGSNDGLGDDYVRWPTSVHHTQDGADGTWHHARECEAATVAQAQAVKASEEAASQTSTPPEEAQQASSSGATGEAAPDGPSDDPTAPQSGSGPSDSSGVSPEPAAPNSSSESAPSTVASDPTPAPDGGDASGATSDASPMSGGEETGSTPTTSGDGTDSPTQAPDQPTPPAGDGSDGGQGTAEAPVNLGAYSAGVPLIDRVLDAAQRLAETNPNGVLQGGDGQ